MSPEAKRNFPERLITPVMNLARRIRAGIAFVNRGGIYRLLFEWPSPKEITQKDKKILLPYFTVHDVSQPSLGKQKKRGPNINDK